MANTLALDAGDTAYAVYADIAAADAYLEAAYHADSWRAADDTVKARLLVTATRLLDRQSWQALYNTFALRLVVPNIVSASIEMALAILDGADTQNLQTGAERVRSISAGSVSITNFRGVDVPTRFPQIVQELLAPYLGGNGTLFVAKATGTDTETIFPIPLGYSVGGM